MKKLLAVSAIVALGLTSVAFAGGLPEEMPIAPAAVSSSDTGPYIGIEGGFGMTNWMNVDGVNFYDGYSPLLVSSDNGFVGRAVLGYDLTRYFALEVGYSYFFNKAQINDFAGVEFDKAKSTQDVDLMAKIKAPIVDNFDLYGKIGANYLMTRFDENQSVNNFNVAFGAGADYYITPNIIANIEWLRFNGKEKLQEFGNMYINYSGNYQPHTDAFMIGLRYRFDM